MEPSEPTLPPPSVPFAPPTTPASHLVPPPFPPAEATPYTTATLVPAPEPRRRHRALIGGLSVLTIAAVSVGAFAVLADTPDDVVRDDAVEVITDNKTPSEAFSYAAASADAQTAASMSIDMLIESAEGKQTIQARVDRASGRVAMDVDISRLDQEEFGDGIGDTIGMIIDEPNDAVYLTGNVLGEIFSGDIEGWLVIGSDEFSDDSSGFDQLFTNPLTITDVLGGLDPVDLGQEDVAGETLQHFRVTVDATTLAEMSDTGTNVFGEELVDATDVTYEVWVSEDDRVRRISFELVDPESQDRASVSINVETSAEPIDIEVPHSDEVTDLDELFGQIVATIDE